MSNGNTAGTAGTSPASAAGRIQGGSILLFRVAGIDVLLHWSWFFFALLRLQPGDVEDPLDFAHYDSQVWYLVEYLALFVMVLLHEFGHVLACRSVGGIANRIVLWPLGGVAFIDPPARPGAWLWSTAAGPLVNVLLMVPTVGLWMLCRAAGYPETAPNLYRFAASLAWTNGYLLLFNLLPVYPLDGGRILQALLWLVLSRARSLLVATAVGVLTALGVLAVAIVTHSVAWGVMAAFGLLFSLASLQGARALRRTLDAPRRPMAACPECGTAPPLGEYWACLHCWTVFDAFATGGTCPICSTPLSAVLCHACGRSSAYSEWHPAALATQPYVPERPPPVRRPPTVVQRIGWGLGFAFFAFVLCGLPNIEKQPLGLIVWTAAGALLGVAGAGPLTRTWRTGEARKRLRGTWCLVEEDGQLIVSDEKGPRRLVLKDTSFEERVGTRREAFGACWTDPEADPPAISFTPKAGADALPPRPGIYRLEGKQLTVCLAYPGHPRPAEFRAQPGVQQVRVYQRGDRAKLGKSP
jgi:uncharacterized protein (TIGR03067 family)